CVCCLSNVCHTSKSPPPSIVRARFCFSRYAHPRDLLSFPTRRSSDLWTGGILWTRLPAEKAPEKLAPALSGRRQFFRRLFRGKRSEEHTSELQSLTNIVCRLLLEKKKKKARLTRTEPSAQIYRALWVI